MYDIDGPFNHHSVVAPPSNNKSNLREASKSTACSVFGPAGFASSFFID